MRVFVTGATGFVGSAIVQELLAAGHRVLGLVRSEANAQALVAAGAEVHRGSLEDFESLRRGAAACDGVIHTAYNHDFVNVSREAAAEADKRTIETLGAVLAGSNRPLVITSGVGLLASGGLFTEDDTPAPSPGAARLIAEQAALSLASKGVRSSVVRLPPSVHGDGDHGLVPRLIVTAREKRVSAYVGEGRNRWPAVHRLDAAHLFRLALENGPAGSTFHGIAEEGVPTREIAEAIGRGLHLPVVSKSREEAFAHFGWLSAFFAVDAPSSSARTRERLGWQPRRPGLLADLDGKHYWRGIVVAAPETARGDRRLDE
jgi:nucleoside-diphosphate-sugar epimerase